MKRITNRRFLDNLGSAALALLLALVVYVSASYANDKPRDDYFIQPIPIEVTNTPNGLVLTSTVDKTARVRIRAFESSWSTLTVGSFKTVVDLANYTAGTHTAPIKVTCSDRLVSVIETQPQSVYIELEALQSISMPVEARLDNLSDLPLGYSAAISTVVPASVTIQGPASVITTVASVQAAISLIGQRNSLERTVEVQALDRNGTVVTGLRITPASVDVSVSIERMLNYREVAVRALTSGHPAAGYYISGITVDPATVTVVGPPTVVASMSGLVSTLGVIDVTGETKTIVQRMPLDLPEGVSIYTDTGQQRQDVFVTIEIAPVMGGSNVELTLQTRKLSNGLAAELSVPSVDVIITGPAVVLDKLTSELMEAYVDLSGLDVGKHQVKVTVNILTSQVPELSELTVTSISPEFVEVNITPAPTPTAARPGIVPTGR
ncbi:MAG: CdaR family protein [Anaerolineae bacterium]